MLHKFNLNYDVIIYPTEKGWERIKQNLINTYGVDYANKHLPLMRNDDGGCKEQLFALMLDHGNLFYSVTDYLKTMVIELINE